MTKSSIGNKAKMPPAREPCKCSEGHDAETVRTFTKDGSHVVNVFIACETCNRKAQERRRDMEAQRAAAAADARRVVSGFSDDMAGQVFDSYVTAGGEQTAALEEIRKYADALCEGDDPGWLLLAGTCGTGKNHLATAIANQFIDRDPHKATVVFTKVIRLMRRIRATFGTKKGETEEGIIRELDRARLLVLDEFGFRDQMTDWERATFDDILDHRWANRKPLILITNLTAKEAMQAAGERINSRFADRGKVIRFTWDDYRLPNRQEGTG